MADLTGMAERAYSPRRAAAQSRMQFGGGPKKEGGGFLSTLGKIGGMGLQFAGAATGNPLMSVGGSALSSLSSGQGINTDLVASGLGAAYGQHQAAGQNLINDRRWVQDNWNTLDAGKGWGVPK